jgi:hypothetical protein
MKQAAAIGGDMLVVAVAETKKGAELVISAAEPLGRGEALEASHTSDPAFDAAMILLQPIVPVCTGPMLHVPAKC